MITGKSSHNNTRYDLQFLTNSVCSDLTRRLLIKTKQRNLGGSTVYHIHLQNRKHSIVKYIF